jgi:membrane-bound lytic murein transglycosylase B
METPRMFRRETAKISVVFAFTLLLGAGPASAQGDFRGWVEKLRPEAEAAGVSPATFRRVFDKLTPDCELPGVFCPGEKRKTGGRKLSEKTGLPETCNKVTQKEFLRPEDYFPPKYMRTLALRGRNILEKMRADNPRTHEHLLEIETSFNVSRYMLMGLWGRESAYGEATM